MLNDRRSHGLWERTAPPPPATEKLGDDLVADVAIVGAGYTGLSTALHLAERGLDAVVIEAAEIGFGAAGRSTGFVNAGLWVMPSALKETLGPLHGDRLLNLLRDSPHAVFEIVDKHNLQCELKRAGTIHCGADKKGVAEIAERARQWQALGAPVHILNAGETRAKTGTSAFPGGLLDLRAGTIQPLAYVRGLAGAAIAAGATVFTASPIEYIAQEARVWRLATQGGSVRAKWAVLSTNTYTSRILPVLRGEQLVLPVFHVATAPLSHSIRGTILPEGHGAWDTRTVLTAFRTDDAGRLIVGSIGALRGTGTVIHRNWARRRIRALFPQIGDVELGHEWYGRIGMTTNHLPRFHILGEKMIALTGFNGRGIAPGTVFGRELARHISGELPLDAMFLPVSPAQNAPFRAIREGYYELGAQIAHLPQVR
ncbi:FAD-binding oxidoreductase [Mesorhizobium sp. WSM3882]|uniref:NAD(P)/FAD-dependent oxidoreductase n=1 Tax=Mesorhizobium sp. WSM3882 TaxID=2029407 RepID=UPI000BAF5FE5|nr:FAD-binding oxidoreductase [Mesorhizobium sp. WSM3882]PBB28781.1 FAD-dependent oxidoreductase [Mesorhizobium sp. WSM3882]